MVINFIYNEMVKKRNDIFHKHTSVKSYYQTGFYYIGSYIKQIKHKIEEDQLASFKCKFIKTQMLRYFYYVNNSIYIYCISPIAHPRH